MDERQSRRDFAKGFLDGLDAAFDEVEKLLARGHNNQELRVVVPTRKAAMKKEVERQMRDMGIDIDERLDSRPAPKVELPRPQPGDRALFIERTPLASVELLKRLMDGGAKGMALVRGDAEKFKVKVAREGLDVKWLVSEAQTSSSKQAAGMLGVALAIDINAVPVPIQETAIKAADITGIDTTVNDFLKRNPGGAVYLEGVEYLVSVNGFQPVLRLIQKMRERTANSKGYLVMSLYPGAVEAKEQSLVEKEMDFVVPETPSQK